MRAPSWTKTGLALSAVLALALLAAPQARSEETSTGPVYLGRANVQNIMDDPDPWGSLMLRPKPQPGGSGSEQEPMTPHADTGSTAAHVPTAALEAWLKRAVCSWPTAPAGLCAPEWRFERGPARPR